MKHILPSFLALSLFSSLVVAQDNPRGEFYRKDQVKGFMSFKADYRQLSDDALKNINGVLFRNPFGFNTTEMVDDGTGNMVATDLYRVDGGQRTYNQFGNGLIGMNVELGAQYFQFLTWIDANFMPTQVSTKPAALTDRYHDVEWFRYGFDWMFGWMIASERNFINVIPSVGFGVSLQNFRFATSYEFPEGTWEDIVDQATGINDRFYSRFGKTLNTQVELRFNLGIGISVGAYAGARFARYDDLEIEVDGDTRYVVNSAYYQQDANGDEWFVGGKVTYTLESPWEKQQRDQQ